MTNIQIDMENNFGTKVNLKVWVKVKEDWLEKDNIVNMISIIIIIITVKDIKLQSSILKRKHAIASDKPYGKKKDL